jgi:hypothetical protein
MHNNSDNPLDFSAQDTQSQSPATINAPNSIGKNNNSILGKCSKVFSKTAQVFKFYSQIPESIRKSINNKLLSVVTGGKVVNSQDPIYKPQGWLKFIGDSFPKVGTPGMGIPGLNEALLAANIVCTVACTAVICKKLDRIKHQLDSMSDKMSDMKKELSIVDKKLSSLIGNVDLLHEKMDRVSNNFHNYKIREIAANIITLENHISGTCPSGSLDFCINHCLQSITLAFQLADNGPLEAMPLKLQFFRLGILGSSVLARAYLLQDRTTEACKVYENAIAEAIMLSSGIFGPFGNVLGSSLGLYLWDEAKCSIQQDDYCNEHSESDKDFIFDNALRCRYPLVNDGARVNIVKSQFPSNPQLVEGRPYETIGVTIYQGGLPLTFVIRADKPDSIDYIRNFAWSTVVSLHEYWSIVDTLANDIQMLRTAPMAVAELVKNAAHSADNAFVYIHA